MNAPKRLPEVGGASRQRAFGSRAGIFNSLQLASGAAPLFLKSTLCVDKTGTLTMNQMPVADTYSKGQTFDFRQQPATPILDELQAEFAMLASQPELFDPIDRAIRTLADEALRGTEYLHEKLEGRSRISLGKEPSGHLRSMDFTR